MSRYDKIIEHLLSGRQDQSFRFVELVNLLAAFGFSERIKGDHHIFYKIGIDEILNLQPIGSKAKPYQVKQVRDLVLKYHLEVEDE